MTTGGFTSHYFLVLNTVPESELQTSRAIADEVQDAGYQTGETIRAELVNCPTPADFYRALEKTKTLLEARGWIPTVHIDGHGDKDNLCFPSGSMVSWTEIFACFREINIISCNNVFVTCGACESAHALKGSDVVKPTPVYALLAPAKRVQAGTIDEGFRRFYRILIESGDASIALKAFLKQHPQQFSVLSSEYLFELAAAKYIVSFCGGRGRRNRQENLVTIAKRERTDLDLKMVRQKIKSALRDDPMEAIEKMFRHFLIVDSCPENAERFPFPGERIKRRADEERLTIKSSRRTDVCG